MFWFKKKKVVVDCFTSNSAVNEFCPVTSGMKHIPGWFKSMKAGVAKVNALDIPSRNIKGCPGVVYSFKQSFIVPLWSDCMIETSMEGYRYQFSGNHSIDSHDPQQWNYVKNEQYLHAKFAIPWLFYCKEPIFFHVGQPFWNQFESSFFDSVYYSPGITRFTNYPLELNVNMFFRRESKVHKLDVGMPFLQIVPLTEREVEFKTQLLSEEEYNKIKTDNDKINGLTFKNVGFILDKLKRKA